jgi:hypothetical protein
MNESAFPIQRPYDLSDLSTAGYETKIEAGAEDLRRIAQWAGVEAVTRFVARVTLHPLSQTRFQFDAELEADIVQICVVTLEQVETHIARSLSRILHLMPGAHRFADKGGIVTLADGDDDEGPEEIASPRYDLAAPILEDFVLAIDRYPRAPGVAFEASEAAAEKPESPFAVLKKLKPAP